LGEPAEPVYRPFFFPEHPLPYINVDEPKPFFFHAASSSKGADGSR
jgi:hypothetical protein